MNVLDLLKNRRSIRKYLDVPLEWSAIGEILECARFAPLAGNLQNNRFLIIIKEEKKEEIAKACLNQSWIKDAPVIIVVCSDDNLVEKHYGNRGKKLYTIQNSALAASNIITAAASLDIASCFISAFDDNIVKRVLKLPDTLTPQVVITLGYADEKPISVRKDPLKNLINFEEYGKKERDVEFWPVYKQIKKVKKKIEKSGFLNSIKKRLKKK